MQILDVLDARGGTALCESIYLSLEHIRQGKEDKKVWLHFSDSEDGGEMKAG